ncbi:hypothetical protein GQ44DRAFT_730924 [Phaeosphaeriaceae sp. PMI808]|nr:hypothetical protein GQ44DRAFT_730924 [Phaeosphaeriaceae sp. PMI808]
MKLKRSPDIAKTICASIIALCIVSKLEYLDIEQAISIKKGTCSLIVQRAIQAVGNEDILDLLDYTEKENNRADNAAANTKIYVLSTPTSVLTGSQEVLSVFTDETYISTGGRPHKRRKVTTIEGQAPETRASGARSARTRVAPPYLLWERETPKEKQLHQAELDRENLKLQQADKNAQAAAEVDGTIKRCVLGLINANIDLANKAQRRQGHQKDWFLYCKFVLHERLFPYIRKLQKLKPNRTIVVVKDGAPLHVKAGNRSASKDAVTEGRALIADEWSRIRPKARQLCLGFEAKLRKVIELGGNNNYHG